MLMAAMTFGQAIAKKKKSTQNGLKNHQQILPLFLRPSDTQTLIAMEHPPAWFEDVPSELKPPWLQRSGVRPLSHSLPTSQMLPLRIARIHPKSIRILQQKL